MENKANQNEPIYWDDDSGEIHILKETYKTTKEDGWKVSEGFYKTNSGVGYGKTMFKGESVNMHYETDDYRKVIPAYIIGTIFFIALCVVMLCVKLIVGIIFSVFGVFWVVGLWAKAPYKKWKNQAKRLKDEKKQNNLK